MSTVTKVNFEPVSNLLHVQTRDFPFFDPTLADPNSAAHAVDGEWMALDTNYKMVRAADVAAPGNAATAPSYPLWAERGRSDVQALGERKASLIYLGPWEFDTRIFLVTTMAVNRLVSVSSIDIGGKTYSGLVDNGTFGTPGAGITVGFVTRMPANNGGKLRIRGGNFF